MARYIADARLAHFPLEVVEKAALCLLDSIGCSMAGSRTRRGDILHSLLAPVSGGSVIIGRGLTTTRYEACFYNAMTANFLELDDSYDRPGSIMFAHPGATIIPPVLALAGARNASGHDVLEAIVTGYEVCLRVGAAIQPSYHRAMKEVWGCATFQTFGAVAAAARLLKLDFDKTLDALGTAGATAPVSSTLKVWRDDHPDMHNGYGWAAEAGLRAALMAAAGYTAPHDILDGEDGFWRMYGSDQCDFDLFTDELGEKYLILDISFKPWPACRWAHPVMDAAQAIRAADGFCLNTLEDISRVGRIVVRTFRQATLFPYTNRTPKSLIEGQFSTPFCAAAALLGLWPQESLFGSGRILDERLSALLDKIEMIVDPAAEAAFPGNGGQDLSAGLRIEIDGKSHDAFVPIPFGDRRLPMSRADLEEKFRQNNQAHISAEQLGRLFAAIDEVRKNAGVEPFLSLLTVPEFGSVSVG